ncbi:hypothetical protein [[Flexibacter] sp. ATCC 35103]|uniref:hypothetical protein n=1 Tax=[Flexibacter] sp. ATCC 35103 TaxID=1937528 RepID=UPI0009C66943|nr:hypothetical protein [[Flexibacter] sp. ATCC 35103]OMQ11731.1 hypothetical protein BXU01_09380 [[Flexibacter] sp. ATCC 35103]
MKTNTIILLAGLILILISIFTSYRKAQKNESLKDIDPNQLIPGPIVHDKLSDEQIEKITKIQSVFSDVYPISLEDSIKNFKRDRNPDNEIRVWYNMMNAYEKFVSKDPQITLEKKSEAFKLILSRSMMDESKVRNQTEFRVLNDNEVNEIFANYTLQSKPIITA